MSETQNLLGFTLGVSEFECVGCLKGIDMLMTDRINITENADDRFETCRLLLSCTEHDYPKYVYIETSDVYHQFDQILRRYGVDVRNYTLQVSGLVKHTNGQRGTLDARLVATEIKVKS